MSKSNLILVLFMLVQVSFVYAVKSNAESFKQTNIKVADCKRIVNLSDNNDTILKYARYGIDLAVKSNDSVALNLFYSKLGDVNSQLNNFSNAIKLYEKAINYSTVELNTAEILKRKGALLSKFHKYNEVLKVFLQALKIYEHNGIALEMGKIYNNVGTIYKERYKTDSAIVFYSKALDIFKSINNKHWQAYSLNLIGNTYLAENKLTKAKSYYNHSSNLLREINDSIGISKSLTNLARVFRKQKQFRQSLKNLQNVLEIRQALNKQKLVASTLNDIGGVYQSMGNYAKSLEYFQKSLVLRREVGDQFDVANSLMNIGTIYRDLNLLDPATTYYTDALEIFQKLGDESRISNCLNYIGGLYYKKREFDHALDYYLSTLGYQELVDNKPAIAKVANSVAMIYKNMKNYDKALEYYNYALKTYTEIGDLKKVAITNNNIGNLYVVKGDNKKALTYFKLAYSIRSEINDFSGIAQSAIDLSNIYYQKNRVKNCLKYLKHALKISQTIDDYELKNQVYFNLYRVYKKMRKYKKSLYFHEQYSKWTDSLFNKKTVAQLSQVQKQNETERSRLKLKYESEKQELEINRLIKIKTIQENNLRLLVNSEKNEKRFVYSVAILLFIILLLLLKWYLVKSKSNKKLRKINDDLAKMNDLLQGSQHELVRLNQTKDKFFEIIAHDLNKPFSAFLSSTNALLNNYTELPEESKRSTVKEIHTSAKSIYLLTENLLTWARTQREGLVVSYQHTNLQELLGAIIEIYSPTLHDKKIIIDSNVPNQLVLNTDEYLLSFILRNVIGNSIKFTPQGGEIKVKVKDFNSKVEIRVIDTGIGMTKQQVRNLFNLNKKNEAGTNNEKGIGLGLILCKEFVEKLNGLLQIESQINIGTELLIVLPK